MGVPSAGNRAGSGGGATWRSGNCPPTRNRVEVLSRPGLERPLNARPTQELLELTLAVQQVEFGIDGDPGNAISAVASTLLQPLQRGGSIAKTGMDRRDFVWADVTALGLLVQLGEHGASLRALPHRGVEATKHLQDRRIVIERAGFQQRLPCVIVPSQFLVPQAEHRVGN